MTDKKTNLSSEWTYLFDVEDVDENVTTVDIRPDDEERKNIARRLKVESVDALTADVKLHRPPGDRAVQVEGRLRADVVTNCAVTLEPLVQNVEETFEAWYADANDEASFAKAQHDKKAQVSGAELELLDEKDDPEPLVDGCVDLGELVVQYLSLAIDPYPQKEGVAYDGPKVDDTKEAGSDLKNNPFEKLKELRDKK